MDEYRGGGTFWTGADSTHFNVFQIDLAPWLNVPEAQGNMHVGEHDPWTPFGWAPHFSETQ